MPKYKIRTFTNSEKAVNEAVKRYKKIWTEQRKHLNETLSNQNKFVYLNGPISEITEYRNWPSRSIAVTRRRKIFLLESSVHSQPTLDSAETIAKVLQKYDN